MTGDVDALREDLDAARAELLAAFEGARAEDLARRTSGEPSCNEGPSVRDILWRVGVREDFIRRWMDASRRGAVPPTCAPRRRPPHMETTALLRAWLDQSRRATLVLLAKLSDDDLDALHPEAGGGARSYRDALHRLARHDREHAAYVRAVLRG